MSCMWINQCLYNYFVFNSCTNFNCRAPSPQPTFPSTASIFNTNSISVSITTSTCMLSCSLQLHWLFLASHLPLLVYLPIYHITDSFFWAVARVSYIFSREQYIKQLFDISDHLLFIIIIVPRTTICVRWGEAFSATCLVQNILLKEVYARLILRFLREVSSLEIFEGCLQNVAPFLVYLKKF